MNTKSPKAVPIFAMKFPAELSDQVFTRGPWHIVKKSGKPYLRNRKGVYLHSLVLPPVEGMEIDHKDGDALNNVRDNLRYVTHHQNQMNMSRHRDGSSKFKGVFWFRRDAKWAAQICFERKRRHLGYFQNEEDAARAYDSAARCLHGQFAKLNFK